MSKRLGRNLDHCVVGNLPLEQIGCGHQPAKAHEHGVASRPALRIAGKSSHRGLDALSVNNKAIGRNGPVLVEYRLAGEVCGWAGLVHGRSSGIGFGCIGKGVGEEFSSGNPHFDTKSARAASIMAGAPQA